MQSVIPVFDICNTFFQSEEPLVHLLQKSTLNWYKTVRVRFIKPQNDEILSIDMEDSTNCKESWSVYIGYSTKQYALSKDIVETPK